MPYVIENWKIEGWNMRAYERYSFVHAEKIEPTYTLSRTAIVMAIPFHPFNTLDSFSSLCEIGETTVRTCELT